jgi:hypothetical protein
MTQISQISSPLVGTETPETPAERSQFSLSVPQGFLVQPYPLERKVQLDD